MIVKKVERGNSVPRSLTTRQKTSGAPGTRSVVVPAHSQAGGRKKQHGVNLLLT